MKTEDEFGDVEALADEVSGRRTKLGMTQKEVIERGGPSKNVLQAMESGARRAYRRDSKEALETVLRVKSGSVDKVLFHGGTLEPIDTAVEHGFDPMTSSLEALGRHGDLLNQSARSKTVGPQWMIGVLQERIELAGRHDTQGGGKSHAM